MKYFSYNGEKYTDHPNSVYDHYQTTLGDFENKILAVGGFQPAKITVELFNIDTNTWATKTSFPFCSSE